uniref:Uncharacterized protein n=1 Tax=Rhizophora mucronata TaxID=61149 RepID=A0A2P2PVT3_RHIMU
MESKSDWNQPEPKLIRLTTVWLWSPLPRELKLRQIMVTTIVGFGEGLDVLP